MSSTGRTLRETAPASQRLSATPRLAPEQQSLRFAPEQQANRDEQAMAVMFRAAVNAAGGADALRAQLGERESYLARIADGMNGARPIQLRWLAPLLDDARAAMVILGYLSERAGAEPPVLKREVSQEDIAQAALEVLAESGQMRETFRAQIAKRLGVRVEAVKL